MLLFPCVTAFSGDSVHATSKLHSLKACQHLYLTLPPFLRPMVLNCYSSSKFCTLKWTSLHTCSFTFQYVSRSHPAVSAWLTSRLMASDSDKVVCKGRGEFHSVSGRVKSSVRLALHLNSMMLIIFLLFEMSRTAQEPAGSASVWAIKGACMAPSCT